MSGPMDVDLAVADGHDRYVPTGTKDFVSVGHEGVYEWAVEHLVSAGDRFLDLGCGTGYGSARVIEAGASYDGVDTSPAAIDHARTNYAHPDARFFVADVTDTLPSALCLGSYDVVFSSEVLEHVANPFSFVRATASLLRDGGVCFMGTPNRLWSLDHMPGGGLMARSHVMELTPAALEGLLQTIFSDVTLYFRRFPDGAMESALPRLDRPRLVRGAIAFAREVAPAGLERLGRALKRRSSNREWVSTDIDWLAADEPELEPALCAGLAAVCRGALR